MHHACRKLVGTWNCFRKNIMLITWTDGTEPTVFDEFTLDRFECDVKCHHDGTSIRKYLSRWLSHISWGEYRIKKILDKDTTNQCTTTDPLEFRDGESSMSTTHSTTNAFISAVEHSVSFETPKRDSVKSTLQSTTSWNNWHDYKKQTVPSPHQFATWCKN